MGMLRQQDGTPSEEHDTLDAMTLAAMSPPASWLADPWSHDIPKPFREKIVRLLLPAKMLGFVLNLVLF